MNLDDLINEITADLATVGIIKLLSGDKVPTDEEIKAMDRELQRIEAYKNN